jgi:hypothetical protein
MSALYSTFGGFDVNLRLTSEQQKSIGRSRDVGSVGRTRQCLAIGTVADPDRVWFNLCNIRDIAAMTTAIDLHGSPTLMERASANNPCQIGSAAISARLSAGAAQNLGRIDTQFFQSIRNQNQRPNPLKYLGRLLLSVEEPSTRDPGVDTCQHKFGHYYL